MYLSSINCSVASCATVLFETILEKSFCSANDELVITGSTCSSSLLTPPFLITSVTIFNVDCTPAASIALAGLLVVCTTFALLTAPSAAPTNVCAPTPPGAGPTSTVKESSPTAVIVKSTPSAGSAAPCEAALLGCLKIVPAGPGVPEPELAHVNDKLSAAILTLSPTTNVCVPMNTSNGPAKS